MGTITSGIGLVSGINTSSIIDQLMAIEQQPVTNLQTRIDTANQQKLALVDLSTQLASIKLNTNTLNKPSTFTSATATSSNESVLTATTSGSATPGTYQFQVAQLVTSQQAITNGFSNYNTTPVGAGTITIEEGGGDVTSQTPLSALNGGAGVQRGQFRITDRSGHSAVIDVSSAVTLNDVVNTINTSFDVSVHASISKDGLQLTDLSGGTGNFTIQDLGSTGTATSLGLAQSVNSSTLTGTSINTLGTSTLLSQLNDSCGVRTAGATKDDFSITAGDGSVTNINLSSAKTLGDAINAINQAAPDKFKASIGSDGHSLKLTDLSGGSGDITVAALNGSNAAADLGIAGTGTGEIDGSWVLSNLGTVLLSTLNGGKGLQTGSFTVTNRSGGTPVSIDLSNAKTVQDVLDTINNAGAGITASLKSSGNGIQITDTTGGSNNLVIADDSGSTVATSLGIAGTFASSNVQGANLQRQWVTENSLLSTYNGGKGVSQGVFQITNSSGITTKIDTTTTSPQRIGDIIKAINSANAGVTASINNNGDGILLTDTAGGPGSMIVSDVSGTAAADLNIAGNSGTGKTIDGSFEKTIAVTSTDTLATVQQKIQSLNFGVGAQVINDGTADAPYRLSMTALNTGVAGRVVLDMGSTSITSQNLVNAQDAAVFVGGTNGSSQPLLITSSHNQISGVINGVTLNINSVSSSPVTLSVSRTSDPATTAIQSFTDGFNAIIDKITTLTAFDPTNPSAKGILLGDSTVQAIQDHMYAALNAQLKEGGRYTTLASIGLSVGDGGKLTFDTDTFNTAFATDPDSVQKLFTYLETTTDATGKQVTTGKGLGYVLSNAITGLIDPADGMITQENNTLDTQTQGFNDRITQLNALLDQKRSRLELQFSNMETVLAQLQSQQSSISQIKSLTTTTSSSSSS